MSASLPMPLRPIARHYWFVVKAEGESHWERWEVWQTSRASPTGWGHVQKNLMSPRSRVGGGDPVTHARWTGPRAARFIVCLRARAAAYEHRETYRAWPGPNSNTFVDAMLRECGLDADLAGTGIGKDYRGVVGVSVTSGGSGVQIESPIVGLKIGATEGIELHALCLTIGIDLWPPAIVHPFGDGRFGFTDR